MSDYLFVYGTLMQHSTNEFAKKLRKNCTYIGKGFIYATKYHLGHYPGIKIDTKKSNKTTGELYKFNTNKPALLKELDFYEGYYPGKLSESLFVRKLIDVFLLKETYSAWVYEYHQDL